MRMRLLAAGLGVAFLVALATLSIRPGEGERIPPPETPSEAPQRSGPEPVVPPDSSPVRSPLGPKSPDAGLARFRGTVEVRGGFPAEPVTRVRLLTDPLDEILALGSVRPGGTFEIEASVPPARLPLIVRLEVDRPGWVPCGPLPGVHLVGTLPFERDGVRLAIAPGMEVRGRVTTVGGDPPGVPVRIVQPSEESPETLNGFFIRAQTNRKGLFRALVPSSEPPIVLVQADGCLTVAEQWDSATGQPLEIALPREEDLFHVTGRVVRGTGTSSAQAQVAAKLLAPAPQALPLLKQRAAAQRARYLGMSGAQPTATQTDGRGWYSLSLPEPGTWLLEFRGEFGATEKRVEVGGSGSSRCDAVLGGDTFRLAGSVADRSTGAPVPGALVRFHWGRVRLGHHGERLSDHGSSGRTDDRGEFRLSPVLRGMEPGELDVTAEGYLRRRQEFACPEPCSDPTISVWIERECRALGRVVCEDGRPVPEVYVDTDPRSMRPRKGDEVFGDRTNAEGRFEVGGLPSGVAIRLRARTRPSDRDPCLAESAPFPIDHVREAETVVSFGGPGETIDLGDLVLSALTTPFPGSRPAGIGPDERPSSLSFPR